MKRFLLVEKYEDDLNTVKSFDTMIELKQCIEGIIADYMKDNDYDNSNDFEEDWYFYIFDTSTVECNGSHKLITTIQPYYSKIKTTIAVEFASDEEKRMLEYFDTHK